MRSFSLVGLAIFALILGAVSARLLGLALRTRKAPELLLGLSTAFPLLGFSIGVVGAAVSRGVPARWISEVGGAIVDVGFIANVGFVWLVFRRDERWARALAVFIALAFAAMVFVNHAMPWPDGVPAAMLPRSVMRSICYAWAAIESLRYARIMRRRLRYGLAEPIVADRFSLWGLAHVCLALMLFVLTIGTRRFLVGIGEAPLFTFSGIVFGTIAMIPLTLSFFPPAGYVRHVERRLRVEGAT